MEGKDNLEDEIVQLEEDTELDPTLREQGESVVVSEEDDKSKKDDDEDDMDDEESDDKDKKDDEDDDDEEDEVDEGVINDPASGKLISEDLALLIESDANLTDEFKEKATTIFEAVVSTQIRKEKLLLEEAYNEKLELGKQEIFESLADKVDRFLNGAVEQWMTDNEVAIESGLRTEIAESFMRSMKTMFIEHYVEVPESKKDLVAELETKAKESEEKATSLMEEKERLVNESTELRKKIADFTKKKILNELTESMVDSQRARVLELAEEVEFTDEESFGKKVKILVESIGTAKKPASKNDSEKPLTPVNESTIDALERQRIDAVNAALARMHRGDSAFPGN